MLASSLLYEKSNNYSFTHIMDKVAIAKIRKIIQRPVEFIEKCSDACMLFLIKYLEAGSWLFAIVILGAISSTVLPSDRHKNASQDLSANGQINSRMIKQRFESERKSPSSAIKIKQPESDLEKNKVSKTSFWIDVSDRLRRFPLTATISVRPADTESKLKWALSLKMIDRSIYRPIFFDEFVDPFDQPVVSYGIYFDTYSATKPVWEPLVAPENRKALYKSFASLLLYIKNCLLTQRSSSDDDIADTVARTIELMQNDHPPFVRTQSNFPIGRSASFNLPSAERRIEFVRVFDQVVTTESDSRVAEAIQRKVSSLVNSVQASFIFRVDILKTLIIKIEQ